MIRNMRHLAFLAVILALSTHLSASENDLTEMYRIRVTNCVDGAVQVSLDEGKSYVTVGRVTCPASKCIQGFAASGYAADGRVTATAVHAIRIKSGMNGGVPQVFSIIPREFAKPSNAFETGEVAGDSGIYTDIPAGTAIFRNLSPLVGNPVFLEKGEILRPLPSGYVPSLSDTLVIVAQAHDRQPIEVIIENRKGGPVRAVYPDQEETIAVVERPVLGIGRFDATEYTGVGCINTNHPGVITVSTAPLLIKGKNGEPRGGFQILPSKHAVRIGYIPQYMVVAPPTADSPCLEGMPLLFSEYVGLAYDPFSPKNSFRVDVQVGDGDWRPLPVLVGKHDDALTDIEGKSVTRIRLRFPERSSVWLRRQLSIAADDYLSTRYGGKPPASGVLSFSPPGRDLRDVRFASLYVDGEFRGINGNSPYSFSVDAGKLSVGEHCVEIRASDDSGAAVSSAKHWFYTTGP